jgi:hypothetical protein
MMASLRLAQSIGADEPVCPKEGNRGHAAPPREIGRTCAFVLTNTEDRVIDSRKLLGE